MRFGFEELLLFAIEALVWEAVAIIVNLVKTKIINRSRSKVSVDDKNDEI